MSNHSGVEITITGHYPKTTIEDVIIWIVGIGMLCAPVVIIAIVVFY